MRFLKTLAVLGAGIILSLGATIMVNGGQRALPDQPNGGVRVATLNVHYIALRQTDGPWSVTGWGARKNALSQAINTINADIIGFQEMESFGGRDTGGVNLTLDFLLEQHPDYAAAAIGDPAVFPITQPIFYRTEAFDLVDQGWFFFSDTPDVIYSRTFNGSWPAFASWAEFQPRRGGPTFRVYNVHFEYRSRSNRQLSAQLVVDRLTPVAAEGVPILLIGDTNGMYGAATMDILRGAGLTFDRADGATYHMNRGLNLFGAIDHIGRSAEWSALGDVVVIRQKFDGTWPSDHYPVVQDLMLTGG